jgi:hypothetical protein
VGVHGSRFKTRRMKIKDLPHRKLRHLAVSPMVLSSDMIVWVGASVPCGLDRSHADLYSSHYQMQTPMILKRERARHQRDRGVCANTVTALAFPYHISAAKRARKGTVLEGATALIDVATEATNGFNSLKTALGALPAMYANREVRLRPPC